MDSRPVWGPTVLGPVVHFLEVDNWAPDSWAPGELSSRIVVFGPYRALRGENTISKRCVQFTILDSILIFLPNIWVSYQVGLLSFGGEGTISKKVCTIQHSWFYPDFFAKHLGELSSLIVVFGPCRALRGENTISKMCVQFNILDSILICLPNIWGNYQVWLLSLGPVGPWGGKAQFLKCVYN